MRNFRVKTGPSVEPVTVDEVKLFARVAHSVEDSIINQWIKASRKMAEEYQHRTYLQQVYTLTFDEFPSRCFDIPQPPLVSIDSFKYYDTDNTEYDFDSGNYFVDLTSEIGRVALNDSVYWPTVDLRPINGVIIEFTAGYGTSADDVPESVKNAIYLYCTHMYENRDSESGSIPKQFFDILRPDRMAGS